MDIYQMIGTIKYTKQIWLKVVDLIRNIEWAVEKWFSIVIDRVFIRWKFFGRFYAEKFIKFETWNDRFNIFAKSR